MKAFIFLVICSIFLSGCALSRVSKSSHELEVNNLKLVGLTYAEAIKKVEADGFSCYSHLEFQPYKSSKSGGQIVKKRTCWKKSAELFCPQRRYVYFEFSVADERILSMWSSIEEKSCF